MSRRPGERLVSDATTMTVLLAALRCPAVDEEDTNTVIRFALHEKWSDALDIVRRYDVLDGPSPAVLLGALEEANEEAARTLDEREPRVEGEHQELDLVRGEWIAPGAVPGLARAMADTIRATVAARETQLDAITDDVKATAPPGVEVERVPDGFRLTGQARPVGEWIRGMAPLRPGEIEAANPDIFGKVTLTAKHQIPVGVALADSTPRPDGLHDVPIALPRPIFSTWFGPVDVEAVQAEIAPLIRAALASVDEAAKLRAERDAIKATCDQHEARVDRAREQAAAADEALREFRSRCMCGAGS